MNENFVFNQSFSIIKVIKCLPTQCKIYLINELKEIDANNEKAKPE